MVTIFYNVECSLPGPARAGSEKKEIILLQFIEKMYFVVTKIKFMVKCKVMCYPANILIQE
jgi:hypothetical protein